MTDNYRQQYERMKRWYAKFEALDKGRAHDQPSDNYVDEIYAFFQNCYHLKDWIKNDASIPAPARAAVETHINSNLSLSVCADICNSLKHLTLSSSRSQANPTFGKKVFKLNLGVGETTEIGLKYEVVTTNGSVDAFQLATDCVAAWDSFMSAHGLV